MGEQTEGIGIALEVDEVVPEDGVYLSLQVAAGTVGKECLYGLLATVAEGWIAQVVGQTGRGDNLSDLLKERVLQFGMQQRQLGCHIVA